MLETGRAKAADKTSPTPVSGPARSPAADLAAHVLSGAALSHDRLLALQRAVGNRAVGEYLRAKQADRIPRPPTAPRPPTRNGRRSQASSPRRRPPNGVNLSHASSAVQIIQRANAADTRLPASKTEALTYAAAANVEIASALTALGTSARPANKNIPALISAQGLKVGPMTPRHDSAVGNPLIRFFPGTKNYAGSFSRAQTLQYHVSASRRNILIRARDHTDIDTMLPPAQIADRLRQAMAEVSQTMGPAGAPARFEIYRGKFNGYWRVAPFAGQSTEWNPALDSRGPRSTRARSIFERIYQEDPAFAAAYDANTAGIHERVDSYIGPDALNALNSPRVQALRARLRPYPTPITTTTKYNTFKADITAGAAALQPEDRQAISRSNQWRALIVDHCNTQARRDEILAIITNQPSAPPVVAPPVVAPPVGPVGGSVAQAFLDGIRIDGPTAPIAANARTEIVTLTPRSLVPNPGVVVSTRFTVTPANRVVGANVSPPRAFPNAKLTGAPHNVEVRNTGTVTMTAQLDLVNNPAGLTAMTPAKLNFTINDNRRGHFISDWETALNFTKAGRFAFFNPAAPTTVRYIGKTQQFIMWTELKSGGTNPGLSFFSKVGVHRGATKLAEKIDAFPHDQSASPGFRPAVAAPPVIPAAGDVLTFKYDLLDTDRTTVLKSKHFPATVKKEITYTKAQAIAAATADNTWIHGTGAGQLLGLLTARGGVAAKLASAIQPPNPVLTVKPFTRRDDSAAYVASAMKPADQVAYFEGTTYGAHPDPNTSIDTAALPAYARRSQLLLNRTTDVAAGTKRTNDEMIANALHEGTHAVDEWDVRTSAEDYRSEFRAYWNEGRFGPPDQPLCPVGASNCFDTTFVPSMAPPGPKSPRARAIFDHIYGSYDWARDAYDKNTDGFREMADNYLHPEGLNLVFSRGLNALQQRVRTYTPATFPALHTDVKGFMGVGPPPPTGALTAADKAEIRRQRSWGLLLNRVVTNATHRKALETTLNIP